MQRDRPIAFVSISSLGCIIVVAIISLIFYIMQETRSIKFNLSYRNLTWPHQHQVIHTLHIHDPEKKRASHTIDFQHFLQAAAMLCFLGAYRSATSESSGSEDLRVPIQLEGSSAACVGRTSRRRRSFFTCHQHWSVSQVRRERCAGNEGERPRAAARRPAAERRRRRS